MSKQLLAGPELTRHESRFAAISELASACDRVASAIASGRQLSPKDDDTLAGLATGVAVLADALEKEVQ